MTTTIRVSKELLPTALKVTDVINRMPIIDGHFWVMRDGKIIDPHFCEYDNIKRLYKGKKFIYKPADTVTQRMIIAIIHNVVRKNYRTVREFVADYIKISGEEPMYSFCIFNALVEIEKNGGELVFGSWGVERKDGSKFFEFGGEDWTGAKAFIK